MLGIEEGFKRQNEIRATFRNYDSNQADRLTLVANDGNQYALERLARTAS